VLTLGSDPIARAFLLQPRKTYGRQYEDVVDEKLPNGFPLARLTHQLYPGQTKPHPQEPGWDISETPSIDEIASKLQPHQEELELDFLSMDGLLKQWDKMWYRLPAKYFTEFTLEELVRLQHNACAGGHALNALEAWPVYGSISKIQNSWWKWSCKRIGYNKLVGLYDSLRQFDFQLPGSEVCLDYTRSTNEFGYGALSNDDRHRMTYIDGTMAFLVCLEGKHVLSIGFSPSKNGILLGQVQLKQPKGNRWLYRLPVNQLEHSINCLHQAFADEPIWLIDGSSYVLKLAELHQKAQELEPDRYDELAFLPETGQRIVAFYGQDLHNWRRTDDTYTRFDRTFIRLEPK